MQIPNLKHRYSMLLQIAAPSPLEAPFSTSSILQKLNSKKMRPFMIISRMIPDDGFLKHVFHMLKYDVTSETSSDLARFWWIALRCDENRRNFRALKGEKHWNMWGQKSSTQKSSIQEEAKILSILKPPIDSSSKTFLNDFQPAWMSESESCFGMAPKSGQNNKTSWKRNGFQAGKCKRMQKTSNVNHFSGTFHWTFLMFVMFGSLVTF